MGGTAKVHGEIGGSIIMPAAVDRIMPIELQGDGRDIRSSAGRFLELEGDSRGAELRGTLGGIEIGEGKDVPELKGDEVAVSSPKPA